MEAKLALNIQNLSVNYKVYEGTLKVIPGVDLFVREGERVGLVGETGCGKTTVLKAAAAVLPVPPAIIKKDAIEVYGQSIDGRAGVKKIRKDLSMIFQDPSTSLNPTLKVSTQMTDVLKAAFPKKSKAEYKQMMLKGLAAVSMPAPERVLDSYPIQLSGGMRQRVCIAMALLKDPILIIADEPTTALDVTIEEQILDLLDALVREHNKALILVSHALGAIRKLTDRLYVMYAGNIVEYGNTMEIFDNPKHPYTAGLLAATPKLTGEGVSDGIAGDIISYINAPKGCRFVDRCPKATDICHETPPVLGPVNKSGEWQVSCHHVAKEGCV